MKKEIILMIASAGMLLMNAAGVFAGNTTTLPVKRGVEKISTSAFVETPFAIIEEAAQFPGGEPALKKYFNQHIEYPAIAKQQGIEGKVIVSFLVDESGKITDVEIVQGIGGGCDEEVIRVLTSMPAWNPTNQAGHLVKAKQLFSFTFQL